MLLRMLIKDPGDQKTKWQPSDPANRAQPNTCGQEGYSTEGDGKDEIEQLAGLMGICGLVRDSA
jgi:hypothetical protein